MATLTAEQTAALQEAQKRGLLTPEQNAAATELLRRQQPPATEPIPPFQDAEGVWNMTNARWPTTAVGQFGTGLNEGIANIAGAPVDLVNAGLNLLGIGTDKPVMGSKFIKEEILAPFNEDEPQTTGQRFLRKAGQTIAETTGALAPLLGAGQKIQQSGKVVTEGAKSLPLPGRIAKVNPQGLKRVSDGLTDIVVQMASMDPAKLAAVEMAYAGGAGLGGQAFIEAFPENPHLADFFGQLTTSLGLQGAIGLIRTGKDFAKKKLMGIGEDEMRDEIGKMMAERLGKNFAESEEELTRRIDEVDKLKEMFPGFEPTVGEVMGKEGGISAQEKIFASQDPRFAQSRREQLVQSQRAIREGVDQSVPGSPEDVQAFRSEAKNIVDARNAQFDEMDTQASAAVERSKQAVSVETRNVLDAVDTRINGMQNRIAQRLQAFPEGATQAQRGEVIRQEYLKELDDFRQGAKNVYDKVDPNNRMRVPVDETLGAVARVAQGTRFKEIPTDWISKIRAKPTKASSAPFKRPAPRPLDGQGEPQTFTFQELRDLRSGLLSDIRQATVSGQDQRAKFLHDILDGVESDIRNIANNTALAEQFPEAVESYRQASRFYEAGYQRLKASKAGMMRLHEGRRYLHPGEQVAQAFLSGETPLNDFMKAIGHRPTALNSMRESAQANFMAAATDMDGKIVPARALAWIKRMKDKVGLFRVFPELEAELTNLSKQQIAVNQQRKLAEKFERNPELWGMKIGPEGQALNETLIPQLSQDQARMAEIHAMTKRSRRELDNSAVMAFIGDDANLAAAKVWGSQNPVEKTKEIMAMLKDPAAVRGFQTAMWDEMVRRFESTAIDAFDKPALQASKMKQFLDRNQDAMKAMGYGEARIERMRKALEGNLILAEAGRPLAKGDSSTAEKLQAVMMDWGPFLSRLYAGPMGRGLVSWHWLMGERVMRALASHFKLLRDEQVSALLMEAFHDPKVARDLMLAATGSNRKVMQKRFMVHLANLGLVDEQETEPITERNNQIKARILSATEQSLSLTHPAGREAGTELTLSGAR